MDADDCIRLLGLQPHPEGGFFRETWRAPAAGGERAHAEPRSTTCCSQAGARTGIASTPPRSGTTTRVRRSSSRCRATAYVSRRPSSAPTWRAARVRRSSSTPHVWQSAKTLGEFTLVGCTVVARLRVQRLRPRRTRMEAPGVTSRVQSSCAQSRTTTRARMRHSPVAALPFVEIAQHRRQPRRALRRRVGEHADVEAIRLAARRTR